MRLKELDMDLPYQENVEFIKQIQEIEGIDYDQAVRRDYELNWKEKRMKFREMTRCMTSMVERIMNSINTTDCWKIIFECTKNHVKSKPKNLLGAYCFEIDFDIEGFFLLDDYEKKKIVIETILRGVDEMSEYVSFELTEVSEACKRVIQEKYVNEWMWKKPIKQKNRYVQIKVKHGVNNVEIIMVFMDKCHNIIKEIPLISTIPDEIIYCQYLGKLQWISEDTASLTTRNGEIFTGNVS